MKTKFLYVAAFALAFPAFAFAQAASTFVKAAPDSCWQAAKEYVKQNATGFAADDAQHLLTVPVLELADGGGEVSVAIRALPDKNKRGEEGCSIVVNEEGNAPVTHYIQRTNSKFVGDNYAVANRIAAFVAAKAKAGK
ncbi:MAG: hypothetical protein ACRD5M_12050 [Candidatus Acidiferrales bacterium]